MNRYKNFIFKSYGLEGKTLNLNYSLDNKLDFAETYTFDFDFTDYDPNSLDRACQLLFFMAGVSYYKTYLPTELTVEAGRLDKHTAGFLSDAYQKGLREFFYINKLDPNTPVNFTPNVEGDLPELHTDNAKGLLVGIGGGKDSLVSVDALKDEVPGVTTWSVGHRKQLEPLVNRIGLKHYWVDRQWDRKLLELNKEGALNGHVPISAILACVGTVVAILSGCRDVVVSNEHSANEPTLHYQGVEVNHQYSKSEEFEEKYQRLLQQNFGDSLRYYSFLRPLSEVRIAEIFAKQGFDKYKDVFSSCNRAFTHDSPGLYWDGSCPKCAFVFMALTPFLDREKLENLFSGKNLLLDPDLESTYKNLLGIEGEKPLECVGEVKESRSAMEMAKRIYPQLEKYRYELPIGYDYRALSSHSMPPEISEILTKFLKQF